MRIFTLLVLFGVLPGCGSDSKRTDVSGKLTFGGSPIIAGRVEFVPDSTAGNSGPTGYAIIKDGRFDTSVAGQAPVPGATLMRVTAFEAPLPAPPDDPDAPATTDMELTPPKMPAPICVGYEVKVDLTGDEINSDIPEEARGFGVGEKSDSRQRGYVDPSGI